jgi:uncharacterized protein (TIGR02145 family)
MKRTGFASAMMMLMVQWTSAQLVVDFDGNAYNTVAIGTQTWIRENLRSLHYSDGAQIPGASSYNGSDSLALLYGRLYTWNAAMRDSTVERTQGVCPCGWHVPSDAEWSALEAALGGAAVAGGKLKDTLTDHWTPPNTGASNSSGFGALPAGEYDGFYSPHVFQYLSQYAVFWTSTQAGSTKAVERYLAYNSEASSPYNWYKVMKYSVRCIKDEATDVGSSSSAPPPDFSLLQNYPDPFNPTTTIRYTVGSVNLPAGQAGSQRAADSRVRLVVYDMLGREIAVLMDGNNEAGSHSVEFDASGLSSGVYFCRMTAGDFVGTKRMLLIR